MKIYLVGGAVRDKLLNLPVKDKDWVVTGASIEDMLALKYQQVGKDFPVFIHPKTRDEYALARTERKQGSGHTGFICDFSPAITLEQDLKRRDLTINAIAIDANNKIIDPCNGRADLDNKILRHVSKAFIEDPLRVLRVARFAARFANLGFTIAPATMNLMAEITQSGELEKLTAERVWLEWQKSLGYERPDVFLQVLYDCGALKVLLPEIERLFNTPEKKKWHPEGNTGIHTLMVAKEIATITQDEATRFAAELHDLGKGLTPSDILPSHKGHELGGVAPINDICTRFKVPNKYHKLALLVCKYHSDVHQIDILTPTQIVNLLNRLDVWRNSHFLEQIIDCCIADTRGRLGFSNVDYPQACIIREFYKIANTANVQDIIKQGYTGSAIKEQLDLKRAALIEACINNK